MRVLGFCISIARKRRFISWRKRLRMWRRLHEESGVKELIEPKAKTPAIFRGF
jgi:hypothetical protein